MKEPVELLILNTAVVDIRSPDFVFASELAGPGGLTKCRESEMPSFRAEQYRSWMAGGLVTAGGPGNTAPLAAHAGLRVAVGAYLGRGAEPEGLDLPGGYFRDVLLRNGVDVSALRPCQGHATGQTFIHHIPGSDRGGLAYFPNANHAFDFDVFCRDVERLRPKVVYYMYSGLSDRGDAHEGKDLAAFMSWCREQGCITIADSHTLCADPEALIREGRQVESYRLLEPLLPELDVFFTSWDEARLIGNTLGEPLAQEPSEAIPHFLEWILDRYTTNDRPCLFGVTRKDGAFVAGRGAAGRISPRRIVSRYLAGGGVVDLVGAGDSFRAGLVSYLCRHLEDFRAGCLHLEDAVQLANLMAILYITAPLEDRYGQIPDFPVLLDLVRSEERFDSLATLQKALAKRSK